MELIALLATIILLATLATLFFSFVSYFVTLSKRRRRQGAAQQEKTRPEAGNLERAFFERYVPDAMTESQERALQYPETEQWT